MMEVDEPRSPVNEVFGYRRIKWKIKNYYASSCGNDWIRSPIFCVYSPFLTIWQLGIKASRRSFDMVSIYLKREQDGPNRRNVRANWKLVFPREKNREQEFQRDAPFKASDKLDILILRFSDYERSALENSLHLTVKCHIMVYSTEPSKGLKYRGGGCLKSLSQDLAVLCNSKENTDTQLFYGCVDTVNVHRSVVCCRNDVFKSMINIGPIADLIFPTKYLHGLEKLILFLYSGNLKHVLRVPSFAIEKAVEDFNVEELKEYFTYDELSIESKFNVDEKQFKWRVCNLDKITEGCIVSHRMAGLGKDVFRLFLYPRGISGTEDYMSVKVQFLGGAQPRDFCVFFGVYDIIHKVVRNVKCWRWPPYERNSMILNHLIVVGRDVLKNVFFDRRGEIKFFCAFQKKIGKESSYAVYERYPVINKINNLKHYEKLSEDMASLYTESRDGDLLVFTDDRVHRVHKMILCSRMYKFTSLLGKGSVRMYLQYVEPEVIDITFHYMYTGMLKETEPETVLKVYRFEGSVGNQGLRNACVRVLEANLEVGNAVRILIAANDRTERGLRRAALRFICSNFGEVSDQEDWETLNNRYPKLYLDVIQFVSDVGNDDIEFEDFED